MLAKILSPTVLKKIAKKYACRAFAKIKVKKGSD